MANEINELTVVARDLEPTQVEVLMSNFGTAYSEAKELATGATDLVVTEENQTDLMSEARKKRLSLKNVRVEVENTRKKLKEQSLREGKAIDGMANIIKALIVPVEEHLEKQEKFAELIKAERAAKKQAERFEKLSQYVADVSLYSLRDMSDEAFETLVASSKEAFEAKKAAEAKAETERLAAAKAAADEQERIRLENVKLKEQADLERRKREAIEKGIAEINAAEAERLAQESEATRKASLAPDKDKLLSYAELIEVTISTAPHVSDREASKLLDETNDSLSRIAKNLRNKAEEL